MHPILCRQALIFRWRIMYRPFFSRCLLLLCPCYDHCSDANQMRNGTPKLGVSLPKAELYLISKLPNTNVQIQTVISRISIFLSIGDKQPILWKEFWRSRKHSGCWPRVRRMQWMAASRKLFKVTDENKTATGSNKQILIPSLVLASKCHLN